MSAMFSYSELAVKIISIAGCVYVLSNIFIDWLLPDIISAQAQELSNDLNNKKESVELSKKQSDKEQLVADSKIKIEAIEKKLEAWIDGIKLDCKNANDEKNKFIEISLARRKVISKNLTSHIENNFLIENIKNQVIKDINQSILSNSKEKMSDSCQSLAQDFPIAISSFSRTSFTYAKVFINYLKKHSQALPDPEFLISLSKLFKSNDFFFFAKGGLFDKPSDINKSDTCKICIFSCQKTKVDIDKNCCLCCYQWPEILEKIKIEKNLQKLLEVIIAKDQQRIISDVLKEIALLIYSQQGQVLCEVESTHELSALEISLLEDKIKKIYKLAPIFIFKINPCLMGGVLVKSNLFRMDNSTYGYLNKVFYKLDAIKT